MVAAPVQSNPGPASMFGLPGITRYIETKDNNDTLVTTLNQASQASVTGVIPFKQTDVILGWEMQLTIAQTTAAGTQTIALSNYFPYNFLGAGSLNMQNQFDTLKWLSGIDLAIWQSYRPMHQSDSRNMLYTTPRSSAYNAQPNIVSLGTYTAASSSIKLRYELPAGLWFDIFYPLKADGTIVGAGMRAFVSPQYMAGTARIVQPNLNYNPAFASTADLGPYTVSGSLTTPATFTGGSATHNFKRHGYYQPMGAADSPPVYNWQYTRRATPVSLSGVTSKDILIPINGQILSVFYRFFDPSLNSGAGGPIPIANIKELDLLYGSGLYRYQDLPFDTQARFMAQHGFLPWEGVLIHDLAMDEFGRITNQYALNTMNTSGVQVHIDFTGAQSVSAYVVIGVEALTYVEAG